MVRTNSTMVNLGTKAPDFSLPDTAGNTVSRDDFAGQPLLVMFICNHCPYVKHVREGIAALGRDYQGKLGVVGIMSNDVENYPDDSPQKMKAEIKEAGYVFPYLYDASQEVAKAYEAACTPDFFVFDAGHALVYRGQMDSARPQNEVAVTGADLRAALDAVLSGGEVASEQQPSLGCNIKWREGNAPAYFG